MIKTIQVYNNTTIDPIPYLTGMFQYYQKHGVTLNYDITNVNVPVPQSTLAYNPLVGNVYVIQGVENLVPQTDHDIVLFFFDYSNWKAPWYWPWPLWGNIPRDSTYLFNGKPFITIGYWSTDQTVAQRFLHEPMHALAKIFGCADVMDTYLNDNNPDSPIGNFAQQFAIFKPYLQASTSPQNTTLPTSAPIPSKLDLWCKAATQMEGANPANHNPGNIRYVVGTWMQKLAIGQHNGFCVFPTLAVGQHVLAQFFTNAATGKSQIYHPTDTLIDFYHKYAPASDGNDPVHYATFVASVIGVPASEQIKNLVQ